MKQFNSTSLYILYVSNPGSGAKGSVEKNDISNPHSIVVGINFANISAGNLYPAAGLYIKYSRLRQNEMASHLNCVNQLY